MQTQITTILESRTTEINQRHEARLAEAAADIAALEAERERLAAIARPIHELETARAVIVDHIQNAKGKIASHEAARATFDERMDTLIGGVSQPVPLSAEWENHTRGQAHAENILGRIRSFIARKEAELSAVDKQLAELTAAQQKQI